LEPIAPQSKAMIGSTAFHTLAFFHVYAERGDRAYGVAGAPSTALQASRARRFPCVGAAPHDISPPLN